MILTQVILYPVSYRQYIFNNTRMNRWSGISVLLLLVGGDIGFFRYSEACNTVSSIECVNSTHFLWCVDSGDGTLVTIGDPQLCPGILVCDDTQVNGCVLANTVTTTESTFDLTTIAPTTIAPTTIAPTTIALTTTVVTTDVTTINIAGSATTEELSSVSDAEFTCTYEGLYKAKDCSRFHVCYRIIWFIKHYFARCSKGLYWSSNAKQCVVQSLSDCP